MKLRKLRLADAGAMLEWMHDIEVVKEMQANFMQKDISDCEAFILHSLEDKQNLHLAICNADDKYLGTVSLKNINYERKDAEFAITVSRDAMGKGYSSYAMKEILKMGFHEMKLQSIYWYVSRENKRAIRFYDKNGYQRMIKTDEDYIWYIEKKDCEGLRQ